MSRGECPDLELRADDPITSPEADALGRRDLARSIASKILARDTKSCMVVGISGSWGSGKTSLLNLVDREIQEEAKERTGILILRFNPWNYSTVDQLLVAFFRDLRRTLSLIDKKELVGKIGDALDRLALLALPLAMIPGLQPAAAVSVVVSPIAKAMKAAAKSEPIEKIKQDLNGYLDAAGIHLVIFIDDLDRAEPECVRLMLQLVRMNADFAHTTYVLAYDRERTARALSTSQGGSDEDGRDYLGKLVQVPFDLPVIENLRLKVEVADAAIPLFELIFNDPDLASHHHEVMNAGFYDLFESIRDAKRFANALAVTMPLVWDEVNVVDFAVLEALRLRHPQLHTKLHEYRWLLLNEARGLEEAVEDYLYRDNKPDREGHQTAFDSLLEVADAGREEIRSLLESLFPQLSRLRYEHSPWRLPLNVAWSRRRLVCSSDHFDSYFYLAPGIRAVSENELKDALNLAESEDREAMCKTLLELDTQGKATGLMRRISMRASDLTPAQIETAIGAFLDVSSDPHRWGHPDQNPQPLAQTGSYMASLASAIEDTDQRLAVISRCIESGIGLCGVVRFTSTVLDITFGAEPVVEEAKKDAISAAACARLHSAAESGEILHSPCTASLLYRWLKWDPEQAREYVKSLVQDGATLVQLLGSLRRTAGRYSDASGYEEPSPQILPKILNHIVEMGVVVEASRTAEAMLKQSDNTEEAETLKGFIEGAAALAEEKVAEEEQQDV